MDELDTREWVDQVVAGLPYARALSAGFGFRLQQSAKGAPFFFGV